MPAARAPTAMSATARAVVPAANQLCAAVPPKATAVTSAVIASTVMTAAVITGAVITSQNNAAAVNAAVIRGIAVWVWTVCTVIARGIGLCVSISRSDDTSGQTQNRA